MKAVFADCFYWIAIVKPDDPWVQACRSAKQSLGPVLLVTTDEVLTEFLAALSTGGPHLRRAAAEMVNKILDNPNVKVVPQSRDSFLKGLRRYADREDKEYSLTDCTSMNVMQSESIREVLTNDHHFAQEGFTVLITK